MRDATRPAPQLPGGLVPFWWYTIDTFVRIYLLPLGDPDLPDGGGGADKL